MRYQVFVRTAGAVLSSALLSSGAVLAQGQDAPLPVPGTMSDIAPLPAGERESVGAVILMNEPVLAQRAAMQQAQERSAVDTRTMGAGPARAIERVFTKEELEKAKAEGAVKQQKRTPK